MTQCCWLLHNSIKNRQINKYPEVVLFTFVLKEANRELKQIHKEKKKRNKTMESK